MDPIAMVTAVAKAVAGYFGWAKDRQQLQNTAAMEQNQEHRTEQQEVDRVNKAIKDRDETTIREELSE